MKIAFHFEIPPQGSSRPLDAAFFRAALSLGDQLHVKLSRGELLLPSDPFTPHGDIKTLSERLLDQDSSRWTTVQQSALDSRLARTVIFVIVADGLSRREAAAVDSTLFAHEACYLGAIEVDLANAIHWIAYSEHLPLWGRIVGRELRLLHMSGLSEEDRDSGTLTHWKSQRLFERVVWEDIGVQGTIFDPYRTFEHQRRLADLEAMLADRMAGLASQLLLRIEDLDPRLRDTLYAAFRAFSRAELPEELSQVATSCRRFLEQLADALYPPRKERIKDRDLGRDKYLNRLWAYVEAQISGSQQELILANLKDLGNRIDRLNKAASKGVHAGVDTGEVGRLLSSLLVVTHDILALSPPADSGRLAPYKAEITNFMRGALEEQGS